MPTYQLEVQSDYIQRLATGRRPTLSLVELIWNALDADAGNVDIVCERDVTGTIQAITVTDDGTGISEVDAEAGFGRLGGSWKSLNSVTRRDRRALHGREGKGRLHVFALGHAATWTSVAEVMGKLREVTVRTTVDNPRRVETTVRDAPAGAYVGTVVRIEEVQERAEVIAAPETVEEISEILASYLRQYPVRVTINAVPVDPSAHIMGEDIIPVVPFDADGTPVNDLRVTVVEWSIPTTKTLYLCAPDGFVLHAVKSGVQAPDLQFTAYARSEYIKQLYDSNELFLGETHQGLLAVQDACRRTIRDHVRARLAQRAATQVEEWKREEVYPYSGEASSPVERTERQVFDIVAHSVQSHLPAFASADAKTKQFSFQLVRQAIESNPGAMQKILGDVLGLPKQKQDELADLLEQTSLSAIISASKLVTDRLHFIKALECMIFEDGAKQELLERTQLHRMLAEHAWIFGEQYHLSVDDESLTTVLQRHVSLLAREEVYPGVRRGKKKLKAVKRLDGSDGIVDMMMSRVMSYGGDVEREHLVIELKRPTQPINQSVMNQLESYAMAVAGDERFRDVRTKWHFVAISNDMDALARAKSRQPNQPRGLLVELPNDNGPSISLWLRTWSEIFQENRTRHEFFRKQLDYTVTRDKSLEALRRTHAKYFPESLRLEDAG